MTRVRFLLSILLIATALSLMSTVSPGGPAPARADEIDPSTLEPEPATPGTSFTPPPFPAMTVTGDAHVAISARSTNFGSTSPLTVGSDGATSKNVALFQASLSAAPQPEMYLRSATLVLAHADGFGCKPPLVATRITGAWDPATVTWDTTPSFIPAQPAPDGGGLVAEECGYSTRADVTDVVKQAVNGDSFTGIRLSTVAGTTGVWRYRSMEDAAAESRPTLLTEWAWKPSAPSAVDVAPGSPGEASTESPTMTVRLPNSPKFNSPEAAQNMRARVTIVDRATGQTQWTTTTASAPPGTSVSVQVPENVMFNGSHYTVEARTVNTEDGAESVAPYRRDFKVDVYTAVVPAPGCVGLCVAAAAPPAQTFTVPAGGHRNVTMTMPELAGPLNSVGTAWLSVVTPALRRDGVKIYPDDATEPELPTLPFTATTTSHSVMVPTNASNSQLTFRNTSSSSATLTVRLLGATNGYTAEDQATDAAEDYAVVSEDDLEAVAFDGLDSVLPLAQLEPAFIDSTAPLYPSSAAAGKVCDDQAQAADDAAQQAGTEPQPTLCVYRIPFSEIEASAADTSTATGQEYADFVNAVQQSAEADGGSVCRERIGWGWWPTSRYSGCAADVFEARVSFMGAVSKQQYVVMLRMRSEPTSLGLDGKFHLIFGPRKGPDPAGFTYAVTLSCSTTQTLNCDKTLAAPNRFYFEPNGRVSTIHRISADANLNSYPVTSVTPFGFYLDVRHDSKLGDPEDVAGAYLGIRCDSYFRYPGCVFPRSTPTLTLRLNSNHPQSAAHVRDALQARNSAGYAVYPNLLTRTTNLAKRWDNRKAAKSLCRKKYGNSRTWAGDCDEYPFAAANEGCANGPCSVRLIPASDNRSAGGKLGSFTQGKRLLDGDRYYVSVSP